MSDIWERPQFLINPPANIPNPNNVTRNKWQAVEEDYTQQRDERQTNIEKWGFTLPNDQFMALNRAVENNDITVDEGYRLAASIVISQQYNLSEDYVNENFDQILSALNGPAEGYRMGQTAFNFVINKFRNGFRSMQIGWLSNAFEMAETS